MPHFGKAPRRQAATVSSWTWNTSPSAGFSHCSEGGLILRDPSELNPLKCPPGFCLHVSAEIRSIHRAPLQRAQECSGFDRHPSPSAEGWIHTLHLCAHTLGHPHTLSYTLPHKYLYPNTHTHSCDPECTGHTHISTPTHTHTLQHNKCLMIALIWFCTEWDTTQTNMADNSIIWDPAGKFKHFGKKQIGVRAPFISI